MAREYNGKFLCEEVVRPWATEYNKYCWRYATVECNGKWYCWQHDPERKEKKQTASACLADKDDKIDQLNDLLKRMANALDSSTVHIRLLAPSDPVSQCIVGGNRQLLNELKEVKDGKKT